MMGRQSAIQPLLSGFHVAKQDDMMRNHKAFSQRVDVFRQRIASRVGPLLANSHGPNHGDGPINLERRRPHVRQIPGRGRTRAQRPLHFVNDG